MPSCAAGMVALVERVPVLRTSATWASLRKLEVSAEVSLRVATWLVKLGLTPEPGVQPALQVLKGWICGSEGGEERPWRRCFLLMTELVLTRNWSSLKCAGML